MLTSDSRDFRCVPPRVGSQVLRRLQGAYRLERGPLSSILNLSRILKVLRVSVGDEATADLLRDLGDALGLDFWSQLRLHAHTDVMASPQNLDRLTYALGACIPLSVGTNPKRLKKY